MTRIEIVINFENNEEAARASKILSYCYNRVLRLFKSAQGGHYFRMPNFEYGDD